MAAALKNIKLDLAKLKAQKEALNKAKQQKASDSLTGPPPGPGPVENNGTAAGPGSIPSSNENNQQQDNSSLSLSGIPGAVQTNNNIGQNQTQSDINMNQTNLNGNNNNTTSISQSGSTGTGTAGSVTSQSDQQVSSAYSYTPNPNALDSKFSLRPSETEDILMSSSALNLQSDLNQPYNPHQPNSYDEIVKRRQRKEQEDSIRRHIQAENDRKLKQQQQAQEQAQAMANQEENDPALAYMRRMGWKEGQGLGKEGTGITAPLIMKKTDSGAAQVMMGSSIASSIPSLPSHTSNTIPSQTILLLNAVPRGEDHAELQDEMKDEASKYGSVLDCKILELPLVYGGKAVLDSEAVRIFIRYSKLEEAKVAKGKFTNRFFGGRYVNCLYYNDERYRKGELHP